MFSRDKISFTEFESLKTIVASGKNLSLVVKTGSMAPLIAPGTPIEVSKINSAPNPFEIVIFWSQGYLFCHYLLHRNRFLTREGQHLYITKGLQSGEDLPIPENHLLGIVSSHQIPLWTRFKISFKRSLKNVLAKGLLAR